MIKGGLRPLFGSWSMLIIADENIPAAQEAFSAIGEVQTLPGRQMVAADVRDADILLVRSVTRVNERLLSGSNVRFVGSATIGTDHVDLEWLAEHDISFANAPASNAISAAEYVISALLHVSRKHAISLKSIDVGIVGCGNVGSRVQSRLEAMGLRCLVCDPPRAEREGPEGFVSMSQIASADVVSVHVPLVKAGRHRTVNLIDRDFLESLGAESIFINTSRGDVVDEGALTKKHMQSEAFRMILDVWNNEPVINTGLAGLTDIATPHIAGYSIDGKLRATQMLYDALANYLGIEPVWQAETVLPKPEQPEIELSSAADEIEVISQCMRWVYDITADDQRMRDTFDLSGAERGQAFDRLRKQYPLRRECSAYRIDQTSVHPEHADVLKSFGFTLF